MAGCAQFTMSFNLGRTNQERLEAFDLYHRAFYAEKTYEGTPPNGGDIHIMMKVYGLEILLGPGGDRAGTGFDGVLNCEIRYTDEGEFLRAYDILVAHDSQTHSLEGPFPWAERLALVTDKFGIGWALYYN